MKLKTLCVAMLLAAGSIGIAYAGPTVLNGNFTSSSPPNGTNGEQFNWGGAFVDHWTGNGYTIWYPSPNSAVNGCAKTQYHPAPGNTNCSTLNDVGGTLPNGSTVNTFVAMDGLGGGLQGSVKQQLSGLTIGKTYTFSFYWGGTQETQASNPANSSHQYLEVGLTGSLSQQTNQISTPLGSFTGWNLATMTFTAEQADPWLSFLAFGEPSGGPPMITLTGVSMTAVPEPSSLGMFGAGLLGLGLFTVFARRRAMRNRV